MRLHTPVLFTLAAAAAAQSPNLATETFVGVFARTGARVEADSIAPNTPITASLRIGAMTDMAVANLGVGPGATPDSFLLTAGGHATGGALARGESGSTPTPVNTPPSQGPVSFLLAWRGPPRQFHLRMGGNADGGGLAAVALDVGADGTVEFRQAVDGSPHEHDFTLGGMGATSARVVLNLHADLAANSTRAMFGIHVQLDAGAVPEQPCRFTNYGEGCDGMGLGGSDRIIGQAHNIEINVRGAFPNAPVVLMFGERPLDVLIPGFRCRLLVNPMVSVPIMADANGNLDNTFLVGFGLEGTVFIQGAALHHDHRMMLLRTSNGARMECGR